MNVIVKNDIVSNNKEQEEWIKEWIQLDEEARQEALAAYEEDLRLERKPEIYSEIEMDGDLEPDL